MNAQLAPHLEVNKSFKCDLTSELESDLTTALIMLFWKMEEMDSQSI